MIYETPQLDEPLTQGDLFIQCPLVYFTMDDQGVPVATRSEQLVLVLTQACDLANEKTSRVQIAVVHEAEKLIRSGVLKAQTIRDHVRRHRVFGWYFLPADESIAESIVDLRDIHTIPRPLLDQSIQKGRRLARIATPYREHLAQHFAVTYSRIALPEPYDTTGE